MLIACSCTVYTQRTAAADVLLALLRSFFIFPSVYFLWVSLLLRRVFASLCIATTRACARITCGYNFAVCMHTFDVNIFICRGNNQFDDREHCARRHTHTGFLLACWLLQRLWLLPLLCVFIFLFFSRSRLSCFARIYIWAVYFCKRCWLVCTNTTSTTTTTMIISHISVSNI